MGDFEFGEGFEATEELSGHLELDRYESVYHQLFSEALADGVITETEREQLAKAADQLGLDAEQLGSLEKALQAAYEAHHGFAVLDTGQMFVPRDTMQAPAPDFVPSVKPPKPTKTGPVSEEVSHLQSRVAFLEDRCRDLEQQLQEARAQVSYEVDFSDLDAPVPSSALDEPEALHRRLRHDPRDLTTLHSMFLAYQNAPDRRWCVAHTLDYLGAANDIEKEVLQAHPREGLIQPQAAVDSTNWRRLLFHPDDEALTSDILAVIVSAVLLAHSAALKQSGQLPSLDPEKRLDPATSTVQAARCFQWAAQALGMSPPQLWAMPEAEDVVTRMVPSVPPVCGLGKKALSGRSAGELAFVAGHQLAYYRPERFIRLLVPDIVDLQDLFLAALAIGNPKLPLNSDVRSRVEPIASAIEPLLEAREIDTLRAAYKHFVEHGGVANLQRWGAAADLTAVRTGFALCGDLRLAEQMLKVIAPKSLRESMDDLIIYATGDRYAKLREHMGINIGA